VEMDLPSPTNREGYIVVGLEVRLSSREKRTSTQNKYRVGWRLFNIPQQGGVPSMNLYAYDGTKPTC